MYVANKHKKDGSESVTAFKAALHPAVKINATSNTTEPGSVSFLPSDKTSESSQSAGEFNNWKEKCFSFRKCCVF